MRRIALSYLEEPVKGIHDIVNLSDVCLLQPSVKQLFDRHHLSFILFQHVLDSLMLSLDLSTFKDTLVIVKFCLSLFELSL